MSSESTESDASSESSTSLARVWRAVKKSWYIILFCGVAVASVAAFYVLGEPKIYRATGTIKIDPSPAHPLGQDFQVDFGTQAAWQYYETQYEIIKSRKVAEETVRRLGLQSDPTFLTFDKKGQKKEAIPVDRAALILQGRVVLEPHRDSQLVAVSYEDADKARAQRVVTTLIDVYIEQNLDQALLATNSSATWLNDQLDKLKQELEHSELDLHQYKKGHQLLSVSLTDQSNMLLEEMKQLATSLAALKVERERLRSRCEQLESVAADNPSELAASELLQSAMLQQLRSAYLEAKHQVEMALAAGKGENHPDVKAALSYQEASRQALFAEVENIRGAAKRDLQAVEEQLSGLNSLNAMAKQRAMDLNINEIEYKRLERTKDNTEKMYSLVLERAKESDLTGQMRFNNVQVVDRPLLPGAPVRPRVTFTVMLGAIGGLLLGVGLALGRELLDTSVKTPDDVRNEGGVAFLGLVPRVRAGDLGGRGSGQRRQRGRKVDLSPSVPELYALDHPTSGFSEALRAVRTNLQFMSPDKPFRRLLVTSAGPAEGKTTMGCGLAIALAQAGKRVLLMDCDLRRPRIHAIFKAPTEVGVTTAVLNPELLDEVSLATDVENLDVLPAGPLAPNPAELLQSESFLRLLDRLSERYDRVVIDSPPILPVTDAAILSTLADGTVVVVKAFVTSRHMFAQAVRGLQAVGAHVAGCLLNAVDLSRTSGRYQYYYYRRGYAADETSLPPPNDAASDQDRSSNA